MVFEQVVENDAVARREDTLEVHSSFFRKLRFDKEVAAEKVFLFEEIVEDNCVAGDSTGALRCRNRVEKPDTSRIDERPLQV